MGTLTAAGRRNHAIRAATVLMLPMDGTDTSTSFPDSSYVDGPHTVTANGNVQVDTAQSQFGGASALYDNVGDYQSVPSSTDFNMFGVNWTAALWFRPRVGLSTGQFCFFQFGNDNANTTICYVDDRRLNFDIRVASTTVVSITDSVGTFDPSVDWHHLAVVRNGSDWELYVDGALHDSVNDASDIDDASKTMNIGFYETIDYFWDGHIDDFQVINGHALDINGAYPVAATAFAM